VRIIKSQKSVIYWNIIGTLIWATLKNLIISVLLCYLYRFIQCFADWWLINNINWSLYGYRPYRSDRSETLKVMPWVDILISNWVRDKAVLAPDFGEKSVFGSTALVVNVTPVRHENDAWHRSTIWVQEQTASIELGLGISLFWHCLKQRLQS